MIYPLTMSKALISTHDAQNIVMVPISHSKVNNFLSRTNYVDYIIIYWALFLKDSSNYKGTYFPSSNMVNALQPTPTTQHLILVHISHMETKYHLLRHRIVVWGHVDD